MISLSYHYISLYCAFIDAYDRETCSRRDVFLQIENIHTEEATRYVCKYSINLEKYPTNYLLGHNISSYCKRIGHSMESWILLN